MKKSGFVGNGADNNFPGSALAADMTGAVAYYAAAAAASTPWDFAQSADERLHIPRHHPVQPQAVGRRRAVEPCQ